MNAREKAKTLLVHYFSLLSYQAGKPLSSECLDEIEKIVDHIVDAAVNEVKLEIDYK